MNNHTRVVMSYLKIQHKLLKIVIVLKQIFSPCESFDRKSETEYCSDSELDSSCVSERFQGGTRAQPILLILE